MQLQLGDQLNCAVGKIAEPALPEIPHACFDKMETVLAERGIIIRRCYGLLCRVIADVALF